MISHFINLYFAAFVIFLCCYIFAYGVRFFIEYPCRKEWKFNISNTKVVFVVPNNIPRTMFIEVFMPTILFMSALAIYWSYKAGGSFEISDVVQTIVMAMGLAFGERDQLNRDSV